MLQLKTKLILCDKAGPTQAICINTKKQSFAKPITLNINKHSVKYKLSKKNVYLGICLQNKNWLLTQEGIIKKQHINSCLLLTKTFKSITKKWNQFIFKEIIQYAKQQSALLQIIISFSKYLIL